MTKHYSQKDNLISIMKEISKKTPRGIMNSDTQVGHITWQMYLMRDYLKLDGTPLANASNDYSDLLSFAQDNNLITADTTDNSLFKYNSTTDVLTLPNYIDLVLQGGNSVEEKEAGLPNIKGNFRVYLGQPGSGNTSPFVVTSNAANALVKTEGTAISIANAATNGNVTIPNVTTINASRYNQIYSDDVNTVQPPAITLIPQIKYRKATTMYEQIEAVVNYSTTEKVIGTWIDGKPLYQRTYFINTPSTADSLTRTSIDLNFTDRVIDISGWVTSNQKNMIPINSYSDSTRYVGTFVNVERILYMTVGSAWINSDAYITIKYTKTTD